MELHLDKLNSSIIEKVSMLASSYKKIQENEYKNFLMDSCELVLQELERAIIESLEKNPKQSYSFSYPLKFPSGELLTRVRKTEKDFVSDLLEKLRVGFKLTNISTFISFSVEESREVNKIHVALNFLGELNE